MAFLLALMLGAQSAGGYARPELIVDAAAPYALQMFGGGEITFAGMPRFALSADLGYHKYPAPFAGFETRKIGLAISGHWFVR